MYDMYVQYELLLRIVIPLTFHHFLNTYMRPPRIVKKNTTTKRPCLCCPAVPQMQSNEANTTNFSLLFLSSRTELNESMY